MEAVEPLWDEYYAKCGSTRASWHTWSTVAPTEAPTAPTEAPAALSTGAKTSAHFLAALAAAGLSLVATAPYF